MARRVVGITFGGWDAPLGEVSSIGERVVPSAAFSRAFFLAAASARSTTGAATSVAAKASGAVFGGWDPLDSGIAGRRRS